jgi:hypothetical protein
MLVELSAMEFGGGMPARRVLVLGGYRRRRLEKSLLPVYSGGNGGKRDSPFTFRAKLVQCPDGIGVAKASVESLIFEKKHR